MSMVATEARSTTSAGKAHYYSQVLVSFFTTITNILNYEVKTLSRTTTVYVKLDPMQVPVI